MINFEKWCWTVADPARGRFRATALPNSHDAHLKLGHFLTFCNNLTPCELSNRIPIRFENAAPIKWATFFAPYLDITCASYATGGDNTEKGGDDIYSPMKNVRRILDNPLGDGFIKAYKNPCHGVTTNHSSFQKNKIQYTKCLVANVKRGLT